MKDHPVAAIIALSVMLGGLGAFAAANVRRPVESPSPEPAEARADALSRALRAAVQEGIEGRIDQAEIQLAELARAHPGEVLVWMNYGVALSGQGKYDEALGAFDRALELKPDAWAAYGEIATIHRLRGEDDRALDTLEKVPAGEGRLAERLHRDPIWRGLRDARLDALREKHGGAPETSVHIEDVTARP